MPVACRLNFGAVRFVAFTESSCDAGNHAGETPSMCGAELCRRDLLAAVGHEIQRGEVGVTCSDHSDFSQPTNVVFIVSVFSGLGILIRVGC